MIQRIVSIFCLATFMAVVAGCDSGKGSGFVGRWVSEKNEKIFMTPSSVMEIRREGDLFHVDREQTYYYGTPDDRKKITNTKYEAKAESDTVLSMKGGILTMRLQDDRLYFGSAEYVREK